jgi:hypothetical protein
VYANYVARARLSQSFVSATESAVYFNWDTDSAATSNTTVTPGNAFEDCFGIRDNLSGNRVALSGGAAIAFNVMGTTDEIIHANVVDGPSSGPASTTGILDYYSSGQVTTGNTLDHLATGIFESDIDGLVAYNHGVHDGTGIDEEGAFGIRYIGNRFSWGTYGVFLYDPGGTLLKDNVTNHNSRAGIFVSVDNLYCAPCSARLIGNTADENRRGMYSQVPTTGYGNRAAHNTVVNCHNVVCRP